MIQADSVLLDRLVSQLLGQDNVELTELAQVNKVTSQVIEESLSKLVDAGFPVQVSPPIRLSQKKHFLNPEVIWSNVDPAIRDQLGAILVFHCIDSTNDYLLAQNQTNPWAAVLAEYQTSGKGRRGRIWQSLFGQGLCLSLSHGIPQDRLVPLSLVVGVSVVLGLLELGAEGVGLKWPNDIIAHERKLGGILVESQTTGAGAKAVIGIGINYQVPSAELSDYGTASLDQIFPHGLPDRNEIASALIGRIVSDINQYVEDGFQGFQEKWQRFDTFFGRPVDVVENSGRTAGVADGVDADGALRLRTESGLRRFVAGQVSLRLQT